MYKTILNTTKKRGSGVGSLDISKPFLTFSQLQGVLPDGREIAIKRLYFNNRHRASDFYNEVNIISSMEHKNLVRLLGCSCSGPESFLIYEYLANRSLDRFIFGNKLLTFTS